MVIVMISILIPAYNNDDLLYRQLDSISKQSCFDLIEVIVSDDCSKFPLGKDPRFDQFRICKNIKWYRQDINLGVVGNLKFLYSKATFNYLVFSQHDDFYIDNEFFSRSYDYFTKHQSLGFIFSNCYFEGSNNLFFHYPTKIISGLNFSRLLLKRLNTSWSSIIFNKAMLEKHGGFAGFYLLDEKQGLDFSTYTQEEGMAFLYLLSINCDVLIESKASCVRGLPPTRFSISENHPGRNVKNDILFFNYLSIAKYSYKCGTRGYLISALIIYTCLTTFGLRYSNKSIINFVGDGFLGYFYVFISLVANRILFILWYTRTKYYSIRHFFAKLIKPALIRLKILK